MKFEIPSEIEPIVPDGISGPWAIETFTVSEDEAMLFNVRAGGRSIAPGTYKRLTLRGGFCDPMMSNTGAEIRDHYAFFRALDDMSPEGRVLIHGLGMGLILQVILTHPKVKAVTVIEKEPDIIKLVAPHFPDPRLTIIEDDAMTRKPAKGERWEVIWHDIWPHICTDNLKDMTVLHRRFARRCDWQGSWCKGLCRYHRDRERREERRWRPFG